MSGYCDSSARAFLDWKRSVGRSQWEDSKTCDGGEGQEQAGGCIAVLRTRRGLLARPSRKVGDPKVSRAQAVPVPGVTLAFEIRVNTAEPRRSLCKRRDEYRLGDGRRSAKARSQGSGPGDWIAGTVTYGTLFGAYLALFGVMIGPSGGMK
ncbi:hypothetical protein OE88DRAFT_1644986 [Heliocybe sulcata]|uniref:Uncharacterized protein n=1 Tax=Heliocybe sulcata TaxID=5364 RepID=A0A5C3N275_9AGAM|nr:hypothetical protein OE88DRAFT_1644986 [Heliocybe sulcata]